MEAIDCLCEVSKQLEDYKETSGEGILEILMKRLTNEPILVRVTEIFHCGILYIYSLMWELYISANEYHSQAARIAIGKLLKLLKLDVKAENIFLRFVTISCLTIT